MTKIIVLLAVLAFAGMASASVNNAETLNSLWTTWKAQHKKVYSATEEVTRFNIFIENFNKIQRLNAESKDVQLAVNKFADLTSTEFKARLTAGMKEDKDFNNKKASAPSFRRNLGDSDLPDSVDWRNKGGVTPVKDQGQCNAGYIFSAIAALESFNLIKTGKLLTFSEQQVVDCSSPTYGFGCSGGYLKPVANYASSFGIELDSDYPYTGKEGLCMYDSSKAYKNKYYFGFIYSSFNLYDFKAALVKSPVSARVQADQDVFQFYSKGVISLGCGTDLNHDVLVAGYQKVGLLEAFIVKNSWGTDWGQDGYTYINTDYHINNGVGACGILWDAEAPFIMD